MSWTKILKREKRTPEEESIVGASRTLVHHKEYNLISRPFWAAPAGMSRRDMDVRPMGEQDAFFRNYDYAGDDENTSNKLAIGLYRQMGEYDNLEDYRKTHSRPMPGELEMVHWDRQIGPQPDYKAPEGQKTSLASKKKKTKRVDLDIRPYPSPMFRNFDYTSDEPNETSPGGGPYHGVPADGEKSMGDWIKKRRKKLEKRRKKLEAFVRMVELKKLADKE